MLISDDDILHQFCVQAAKLMDSGFHKLDLPIDVNHQSDHFDSTTATVPILTAPSLPRRLQVPHTSTTTIMSKILTVFGATGNQGGSVIKTVLGHPQLSRQFRIRAITRDPSKSPGKALADQGVEVVKVCSTEPRIAIRPC